jgi:hypothetical protein
MPSRPCAAQEYGFILAYERCLLEGPYRSLRRCRSGHRTSELRVRDGKTQQEFRELAACCDSGVGFRDHDGTGQLRAFTLLQGASSFGITGRAGQMSEKPLRGHTDADACTPQACHCIRVCLAYTCERVVSRWRIDRDTKLAYCDGNRTQTKGVWRGRYILTGPCRR